MLYRTYARIYQTAFKGVSYLLPWSTPTLLQGRDASKALPELIQKNKHKSLIVVTDKVLMDLKLVNNLLDGLEVQGIPYCIYSDTVANPTIDNVNDAFDLYNKHNCDGIIAFGGGSPMDCAKALGARVVNPKKSISKMKGLFKVVKKLPPLYAIPTTAGTGSEVTIAAVITDSKTHEKYAINDLRLIPKYAILDPMLTENLPQTITSTTGIDALTHAVEAFIGKSNTKSTKDYSRKAVKLITDNIFKAYSNGSNIEARENMQTASYYAGIAFTRAYVGYVHAIAHTLGGFYSVPHGLANAVILPYVLEYYGSSVHKPLAELADHIHITSRADTEAEKANRFIELIKKLNKDMNIPDKIKGIKNEDIPVMVNRANQEANPLYPVPRILKKKDLENIFMMIKA